MIDKEVISVAELSKILGISKPVAYSLTERDDFPVLKIGKRKLILVNGLNEWLKKESEKNAVVK